MFKPHPHTGELAELSLKQRQQLFEYKMIERTITLSQALKMERVPRRIDTPMPSPEVTYFQKIKAKF